jgi:hypothetical protein
MLSFVQQMYLVDKSHPIPPSPCIVLAVAEFFNLGFVLCYCSLFQAYTMLDLPSNI